MQYSIAMLKIMTSGHKVLALGPIGVQLEPGQAPVLMDQLSAERSFYLCNLINISLLREQRCSRSLLQFRYSTISGQSYKHSTIVYYDSRVIVQVCNFLASRYNSRAVNYNRRVSIRLGSRLKKVFYIVGPWKDLSVHGGVQRTISLFRTVKTNIRKIISHRKVGPNRSQVHNYEQNGF